MKVKHTILIRGIDRFPFEYGFSRHQREDLICQVKTQDELRDRAFVEIEINTATADASPNGSTQSFGRISTQLTEEERKMLNRLEAKVAERISREVLGQ